MECTEAFKSQIWGWMPVDSEFKGYFINLYPSQGKVLAVKEDNYTLKLEDYDNRVIGKASQYWMLNKKKQIVHLASGNVLTCGPEGSLMVAPPIDKGHIFELETDGNSIDIYEVADTNK